jgi:hypothetical protein
MHLCCYCWNSNEAHKNFHTQFPYNFHRKKFNFNEFLNFLLDVYVDHHFKILYIFFNILISLVKTNSFNINTNSSFIITQNQTHGIWEFQVEKKRTLNEKNFSSADFYWFFFSSSLFFYDNFKVLFHSLFYLEFLTDCRLTGFVNHKRNTTTTKTTILDFLPHSRFIQLYSRWKK